MDLWSEEQKVGFIRRRQVHEALTHRIEAEPTARIAPEGNPTSAPRASSRP